MCESVFTRLAIPLRDLDSHRVGNPGADVSNCFPGKIKWSREASDGNAYNQGLTENTSGVTDGLQSRRLQADTSVYRNVRSRVVGAPVRARVLALSRHFGQGGAATTTEVAKEPTSTTPPVRSQGPGTPHPTSEESLLSLLG